MPEYKATPSFSRGAFREKKISENFQNLPKTIKVSERQI
jgi:hypothetical protein